MILSSTTLLQGENQAQHTKQIKRWSTRRCQACCVCSPLAGLLTLGCHEVYAYMLLGCLLEALAMPAWAPMSKEDDPSVQLYLGEGSEASGAR